MRIHNSDQTVNIQKDYYASDVVPLDTVLCVVTTAMATKTGLPDNTTHIPGAVNKR